ncbi:MAG: hypothetical protein WKG06_31465 [Segetibacter sp.]
MLKNTIDTLYSQRLSESINFDYDKEQKIVFFDTEIFFLETEQERKEGVISLLDLEGSYLYVTSSALSGADFDPKRVIAQIVLDFGYRRIWFDLFAYEIDKEIAEHLKERDLFTHGDPFFFQYNITKELLRGDRKSLKTPSRVGLSAGIYLLRMTPK